MTSAATTTTSRSTTMSLSPAAILALSLLALVSLPVRHVSADTSTYLLTRSTITSQDLYQYVMQVCGVCTPAESCPDTDQLLSDATQSTSMDSFHIGTYRTATTFFSRGCVGMQYAYYTTLPTATTAGVFTSVDPLDLPPEFAKVVVKVAVWAAAPTDTVGVAVLNAVSNGNNLAIDGGPPSSANAYVQSPADGIPMGGSIDPALASSYTLTTPSVSLSLLADYIEAPATGAKNGRYQGVLLYYKTPNTDATTPGAVYDVAYALFKYDNTTQQTSSWIYEAAYYTASSSGSRRLLAVCPKTNHACMDRTKVASLACNIRPVSPMCTTTTPGYPSCRYVCAGR